MIKKHEDFDKAIGNQEKKIEGLQTYADQLIVSEHYAASDIEDKKKEVKNQEFLPKTDWYGFFNGWKKKEMSKFDKFAALLRVFVLPRATLFSQFFHLKIMNYQF